MFVIAQFSLYASSSNAHVQLLKLSHSIPKPPMTNVWNPSTIYNTNSSTSK